MKLISMTDFVLQDKSMSGVNIISYANFLKQPLELEMFVPCDEEGNVLEEKSIFNTTEEDHIFNSDSFDKYQQAKERCLFQGFEVQDNKDWIEFYGGIRVYIPSNDLGNMASIVFRESDPINKTIEELVKYNLKLTPIALKQIGI